MSVSFPVSTVVFRGLEADRPALLPNSRTALDKAGWMGEIAGAYYFVEASENVASDLRDCLRRRAGCGGAGATEYERAASAIGKRLEDATRRS